MFIQKDGSVILTDMFIVQPKLSLSTFRRTSEFSLWEELALLEDSYGVYKRDVVNSEGRKFTAWLMFSESLIDRVYLSFFLPNEQGNRVRIVEGWNNDIQRKRLHRQILREELGIPPYDYSWGVVLSGVNELDFTSTIKIQYWSPNLSIPENSSIKIESWHMMGRGKNPFSTS